MKSIRKVAIYQSNKRLLGKESAQLLIARNMLNNFYPKDSKEYKKMYKESVYASYGIGVGKATEYYRGQGTHASLNEFGYLNYYATIYTNSNLPTGMLYKTETEAWKYIDLCITLAELKKPLKWVKKIPWIDKRCR